MHLSTTAIALSVSSKHSNSILHLEGAFHARRMAPTEADQKCIDDTKAMFGNCDCNGNGNFTDQTELAAAQNEAVAQCEGYYGEASFGNATSIDEETGSETTIEIVESVHQEANFVGCDVISLWEGQCIDAGGFVARIPDLDISCLVTSDPDPNPPNIVGASVTASLRNFNDCFAASCESTVQKLQSGTFDGLFGLPMLAGPFDPISECEATLVDDKASMMDEDDTTSGAAISTITNVILVGGIFHFLAAFVVM